MSKYSSTRTCTSTSTRSTQTQTRFVYEYCPTAAEDSQDRNDEMTSKNIKVASDSEVKFNGDVSL